jgi:hypothetical protein
MTILQSIIINNTVSSRCGSSPYFLVSTCNAYGAHNRFVACPYLTLDATHSRLDVVVPCRFI